MWQCWVLLEHSVSISDGSPESQDWHLAEMGWHPSTLPLRPFPKYPHLCKNAVITRNTTLTRKLQPEGCCKDTAVVLCWPFSVQSQKPTLCWKALSGCGGFLLPPSIRYGSPAMLTLLFFFAPRVIYPLSDSPSAKMSESSPADEGTTFEHLWSTL